MGSRLLLSILLIAVPALASDGGSGFTAWYNNVWGNEASRGKLSRCEIEDDANVAGFVGYANNLFCHIENDLGVKGTTPIGGKTGNFMFASIKVFVHIEVAGALGGAAYNGYDYEAKLWGCAVVGMVDCTQRTDFKKFAYVTWSYNKNKTLSKGVMIHDQYIQNGTTGNYIKTTWDTGSSNATKTLTTLQKNGAYWMLATRSTTGEKTSATILDYLGGNGRRFAIAHDADAMVAGTRSNFQTGTNSTKNDAVTFNCYSRVPSGDDFEMATLNTPGACNSLPAVSYPNVSTAELAAYVLTDLTGSSGGWTAMSTNPAALAF
jgi:hypothetical protein